MNDEAKEIVEALRKSACNGCIHNKIGRCMHIQQGKFCGSERHAAADMIEKLAGVEEQFAGMEIMLTCAQSAAETWERKCREQCSWISVEERLPDKMATVLFATRNNPAVYRGRYVATGDKQAHYFTTRIGRAKSGGTYAATHWMPLPELPKEEAK